MEMYDWDDICYECTGYGDDYEVDEEGAIGRSMADAPEIDGAVYLNGETSVKPGDIIRVKVENADEYDLWGSRV